MRSLWARLLLTAITWWLALAVGALVAPWSAAMLVVAALPSVNGQARLLPSEAGHRNTSEAEIVKGLSEGTEVILYPANDMKDGARVVPRRN